MPTETNNGKEGTVSGGVVEKIQLAIRRIEDAILSALLLFMILLAAAQIFSRNLFDAGISWGDILVRILVLWVGLFGAMAASRKGDHIKIDLVSRYLPARWKAAANTLTDLFTAVVCGVVAYYAVKFVHFEYLDGFKAFEEVPVWVCESIIPISFFAMALRYSIHTVSSVRSLFSKST